MDRDRSVLTKRIEEFPWVLVQGPENLCISLAKWG